MSSASPNRLVTPRRPLQRLARDLFAVIALKIVLLMLIWWLFFALQPKPDVSPDAVARQLAPSAQTLPEGHP